MAEQRLYSFEKLSVYQDAREYVRFVYVITAKFPKEEQFGLTNQIRRAAVSVPSNIAEGNSRSTNKEKVRFIEIAYGSMLETYCQFQIACDLGYIQQIQLNDIKLHVDKIGNKLGALKRAINS